MNKGKHTAIVTGGSYGIGFAIVEALLDQGARVIVADIQKPDLTAGKSPDWENVGDRDRYQILLQSEKVPVPR